MIGIQNTDSASNMSPEVLVKNIIAQKIIRKRGIYSYFLNMPLLRIICWAIIFLTRIRFPPGVSSPEVSEASQSSVSNEGINAHINVNPVGGGGGRDSIGGLITKLIPSLGHFLTCLSPTSYPGYLLLGSEIPWYGLVT